MGWEKKQNKKKQATGDKAEQRLYKEGLALHLCGLFIIPNRGRVLSRSVQFITAGGRVCWHHRVIKQREVLLLGLITR